MVKFFSKIFILRGRLHHLSTIKDVAALAEVSYATVSRILSQDKTFSVSAATKEKVWKAARSLNYTPRVQGKKATVSRKNSSSNEKYKVGCILHPRCSNDLSPTEKSLSPLQIENERIAPYFLEILERLREHLHSNNMELVFTEFSTDLESDQVLEKIMRNTPDGIIWIKEVDPLFFQRINKYVSHHVGIDSRFRLMDDISTEKQLSMETLVEYLHKNGRNRIAFIGGAPDQYTTMAESTRYQGYCSGLKQQGIAYQEEYARDSNWNLEMCYQQTCRLLELPIPPDAIMCANDNMAFSVFRAIYEHQLSIPKDVAVTGYENMPIAEYLSPSLTTIDIHKDAMAKTAVNILLDRIKGDLSAIHSVTYHADLIIRSST